MTKQEAKSILHLHRPGTADARDPEVAAALALAGADAELRDWLETHLAIQQVIRTRFRELAVPDALKEQILSERPVWMARSSSRRPVALAAVLVLAALLLWVTVLWRSTPRPTREQADLAAFQQRMVSFVLRHYAMTLETDDPGRVRTHLAENLAPADYVLPNALAQTATTGCGVLTWREKPVAMVCFHSGQPLPPGEKTDLFLFIADQAAVADAPVAGETRIAKVNRLLTATWTSAGKIYVLAAGGDEATLRGYLN